MRSTQPPSAPQLVLQLESELDEEPRRGREVVDHDPHVLHPLDRHPPDSSGAGVVTSECRRWHSCGRLQERHNPLKYILDFNGGPR